MMDCLTITAADKVTITGEGSVTRLTIVQRWHDVARQTDNHHVLEILLIGNPEIVDARKPAEAGHG